jgi:hypothetical protein
MSSQRAPTTPLTWVVEAKKERASMLPKPTLATGFEIVNGGKIYHVKGDALQQWIVEQAPELERSTGYMFSKRLGI